MNSHNPPVMSRSELRRFGLLFALVLATLFGLMIPFIRHGLYMGMPFMGGLGPHWPWFGAAAIATWALVHPRSLVVLYTPWMKFARLAQWVNTRIIMLVLFYVMILPIGLLLRMFGKDSMHRKFENRAESYRIKADERDAKHMEKPF